MLLKRLLLLPKLWEFILRKGFYPWRYSSIRQRR